MCSQMSQSGNAEYIVLIRTHKVADIQKQTEDADGSENQNGQNGQNGQQLPQQEPEQERGWFDIFPW